MATSSITRKFVIKSRRAKDSLEKALIASDSISIRTHDTDKLIKKGEKKSKHLLSHYST